MNKIILVALLAVILFSCKTRTVYVPVESDHNKVENNDRLVIDSIYLHDSIYVDRWQSGDTVYINKEVFQYIYKDKYVRDSVYITDSIRIEVPYPVVEVKEVNRLHTWQIVFMCLGGVLVGLLGFRLFKWFN